MLGLRIMTNLHRDAEE